MDDRERCTSFVGRVGSCVRDEAEDFEPIYDSRYDLTGGRAEQRTSAVFTSVLTLQAAIPLQRTLEGLMAGESHG